MQAKQLGMSKHKQFILDHFAKHSISLIIRVYNVVYITD